VHGSFANAETEHQRGRGMSPRSSTATRPSTPAAAVAAAVRLAAAARSRRRTRWFRVGVAALALAALGAAVWAACFSTVLAVRSVTVVGVARLSAAEVSAMARVPTGGSLLLLDTDGPAARVRTLPAVASVRLERHLLHTVRIVVTERTAAVVLETPSGRRLVDATGVAFADDDGVGAGLPVVRTTRADLPAATLNAVTGMLAALPGSIRPQVNIVRADSADNMAVELTDGRVIVWGDAGRPELKAKVLGILLQRKGRTYDVSLPEAPAISRP
jgi:cell division protein FtsQ